MLSAFLNCNAGALRLAVAMGALALASADARAADAPEALIKMRAAFAAAVAKNDLAAAKALTLFPLRNEVFNAPPKIDEKGFAKLFKIYRSMADCVQSQALEPDVDPKGTTLRGRWDINCNGNVLHFGQKDGRWLHVEYENINE